MKTMGKEAVMINKEMIDLRYVEQIVDSEQVTALGYCMPVSYTHLDVYKRQILIYHVRWITLSDRGERREDKRAR